MKFSAKELHPQAIAKRKTDFWPVILGVIIAAAVGQREMERDRESERERERMKDIQRGRERVVVKRKTIL